MAECLYVYFRVSYIDVVVNFFLTRDCRFHVYRMDAHSALAFLGRERKEEEEEEEDGLYVTIRRR